MVVVCGLGGVHLYAFCVFCGCMLFVCILWDHQPQPGTLIAKLKQLYHDSVLIACVDL